MSLLFNSIERHIRHSTVLKFDLKTSITEFMKDFRYLTQRIHQCHHSSPEHFIHAWRKPSKKRWSIQSHYWSSIWNRWV